MLPESNVLKCHYYQPVREQRKPARQHQTTRAAVTCETEERSNGGEGAARGGEVMYNQRRREWHNERAKKKDHCFDCIMEAYGGIYYMGSIFRYLFSK